MLGSSEVGSYRVFIFRHNETNRKSNTDAGKQTSGWTQKIRKPQCSRNCELIIWTQMSHQVSPKDWPYICISYMMAHCCSNGIVMNHQALAVFKATSSKVFIWRGTKVSSLCGFQWSHDFIFILLWWNPMYRNSIPGEAPPYGCANLETTCKISWKNAKVFALGDAADFTAMLIFLPAHSLHRWLKTSLIF